MQLQLKKLNQAFGGERLLFCYEAGPCGYPLYRQLKSSGHHVQVVAPSLIPKRAGVRIKTDRRDADKLASLLRSGELTPVWVPDEETEAMRDLVRARDDLKAIEKKTRQQLNAMVLRHGHAWPATRTRWTKTYYNWLETLKFEHDWNYVVIQEYIEASQESTRRVDNITEQILRLVPQWSLAAVVHSLVALRGVDYLSAIQLLAELGDLSRFDSPKELMAFVGLVPSIHASGDRSRSGAITKTGNRHVRRSLVECAWSYRFPARRTAHLRRKSQSSLRLCDLSQLESAKTLVQPSSDYVAERQKQQTGQCRNRPRTAGVPLRHRLLRNEAYQSESRLTATAVGATYEFNNRRQSMH